VTVPAHQQVSVIAKFTDYPGKFPYHCHMLEHEDNMMMRQFEVLAPPGWDAGPDAAGSDSPPEHHGGGCCEAGDTPGGSLVALVVVVLGLTVRRRWHARA
jgi:MYXO-CTERM domain-containing protein